MKIHTNPTASYPPLEYLPCTATVNYLPGQALAISSGAAIIATETTKPTHICCAKKTGVAGEEIPAIRISEGDTFEAELSASGTSLAVGDKVTIHTDGIKVTATTTSGVAEIVKFCTSGKAAGDAVLIKF